jgi:SAM-dependent methyltransferase
MIRVPGAGMRQEPKMFDRLRQRLPPGLKQAMKPLYLVGLDLLDVLSGHRRSGLPPSRIMLPQFGTRDANTFHDGARWMAQTLREKCGLEPEGKVLDVGCGAGRLAFGLLEYLDSGGGYEGLDVDAESIGWAQRNISPKHPNFRFRVADVRNRQYNPDGGLQAGGYRFPYDDGTFDVAFLHSVFTHLLPADLENYLREIARVLKPGGRSHISYYLLNEEAAGLAAKTGAGPDFRYDFGVYRSINAETPEYSVAYDEAFIRDLYPRCGHILMEPVHHGNWCGREGVRNYQDIVVARTATGETTGELDSD